MTYPVTSPLIASNDETATFMVDSFFMLSREYSEYTVTVTATNIEGLSGEAYTTTTVVPWPAITASPTISPTKSPPTESPTKAPTESPTKAPTESPTEDPRPGQVDQIQAAAADGQTVLLSWLIPYAGSGTSLDSYTICIDPASSTSGKFWWWWLFVD